MRDQNRQTKICYFEETKEYQIKLFIAGVYQIGVDSYAENEVDARWIAMEMEEQKEAAYQTDFCKEEMKNQQKERSLEYDWPIYDIHASSVVGWLSIEEEKELPQFLEVQGMIYQKKGKMNVIKPQEVKETS